MNVTVSVPDSIAHDMGANEQELKGKLLESFAIEGYRSEKLTAYQVGRLLGFESRMQVDEFLKENKLFLDYTQQEIKEQRRILSALTDEK